MTGIKRSNKYVCGGKKDIIRYTTDKSGGQNSGIIIIHDGVRPFVTEKL